MANIDVGTLTGIFVGLAAVVKGIQWIFLRRDKLQERRANERKMREEEERDRQTEETRTAVTLERMYSNSVKELLDRQKAEIEMLKAQDEERRMQIAQLQERCTQLDFTYQRRCTLLEIECMRLRKMVEQLGGDPGPEPEFR